MQPTLLTVSVLCTTVAALVYLNTLDCKMCYDDHRAIGANKDLRPDTPWMNLIWNDFWGTPMGNTLSHKSYRPLCVATFRLNYLIHEVQPMGYHLVNVLLHSAVCYLYVQLCGLVFREVWPALIAGLLFAVHPIHTEAVAGLVGRADVLAAVFFLSTFFCYKKAAYGSMRWLPFSLLLCLCAVLSKETGLTITAVCLVYDFLIVNKMDMTSSLKLLQSLYQVKEVPRWFLKFLIRAFAVIAFTITVLVVRIRLMEEMLDVPQNANPAQALSTPYRQLQWLHLFFVNAWLLLNPFPMTCDWRLGAVPTITSVANPWNLATAATFVAVTALGVFAVSGAQRSRKIVAFALSLSILPYLPASNLFFPVGFVVAERVLYIPSMGVCILVAHGIWTVLQWMKEKRAISFAIKIGIMLVLVIYSAKTLYRNREWFSDVTIFESALRIYPDNAHVMNFLGNEYGKIAKQRDAEMLFRRAGEVEPGIWVSHGFLGALLKHQGKFKEAEEAFQKGAIAAERDNYDRYAANLYYIMAQLAERNESRLTEAVEMFNKAIILKPGIAEFLQSKAAVLIRLNRNSEARTALEEAIHWNPQLTDAHYKLGEVWMHLGNEAKAEECFQTVLLLNTSHTLAKSQLHSLIAKRSSEDTVNLRKAHQPPGPRSRRRPED